MKRFTITLAAIAAVTFGMTATAMAGHSGHHDNHGHHDSGHHDNHGHHDNSHHNNGHHDNHGHYNNYGHYNGGHYIPFVPTYRPPCDSGYCPQAPIVVIDDGGHCDF